MIYGNMEQGFEKSIQDYSTPNVMQDASTNIRQQKIVPRGKKLTTCIKCNKPGYEYQTYFQHYNEPPIGKVKLKGQIISDKYRRCYITKQKVKQDYGKSVQ